MNYSHESNHVRIDFWKPSGKWYGTEELIWTGRYDNGLIRDEFKISLIDHFNRTGWRMMDFWVTCLEPFHKFSHPISLRIDFEELNQFEELYERKKS